MNLKFLCTIYFSFLFLQQSYCQLEDANSPSCDGVLTNVVASLNFFEAEIESTRKSLESITSYNINSTDVQQILEVLHNSLSSLSNAAGPASGIFKKLVECLFNVEGLSTLAQTSFECEQQPAIQLDNSLASIDDSLKKLIEILQSAINQGLLKCLTTILELFSEPVLESILIPGINNISKMPAFVIQGFSCAFNSTSSLDTMQMLAISIDFGECLALQ